MKKWVSLFMLTVLVSSVSIHSTTFAAYGGGWSSVSSSSNFLSRDVCPNWDASSSYYDGTCWSVSTEHPVADERKEESKEESKETETVVVFESLDEVEEWIEERKEALQKAIDKSEKQVLNMPIRYRMVQKQVDGIMDAWNVLDKNVRHAKSVKLVKKINVILASKKLPPKLLMIIQYIQDKAVLMTSFEKTMISSI